MGISFLKNHLIATWRMNWKVLASEPQFALCNTRMILIALSSPR